MPRAKTTRSAEPPDSETLTRLKLSPEVGWYLVSRGIPLPDAPPRWKTPEAGEVLKRAKFDPDRVDRVLSAFKHMRHTQGRLAGKPLKPDPWQVAYVIAPVFGWVSWEPDARAWVRVVNELYVDVPRKNGKTTMSGGFALYLTGADGEAGAQILAAATTKEQAGYTFAPVKHLVDNSPDLKKTFRAFAKEITHPKTGSYFRVVSSVAEALHGANIHGAIIDELHVHKSPDLVEAIETGTGSRDQALVIIITTADDGSQATIYDKKRHRIEQLADRVIKLPSTYGVIWAADENDDPFSEETQRKANPGFGVSPTRAYLRKKAESAKNDPAERAGYLRLHLGIRSKLDKRYVPLDAWDRNAGMVIEAELAGRACYGGLDLASTSDLTALAWTFPDPELEDGYQVIWRHWVPERAYEALTKRTSGQARVWRDQGFLTVTEGDVIDYGWVKKQIERDSETFEVRDIAFDRWNSSQLITDLTDDGAAMVSMGQGFVSMSPPTKQLLHLLLAGTAERPLYRHGGNPLVRWQVDNLRVRTDPSANVKPDKERSMDKIDGLVAGIMSLERAMNRPKPRRSAYEDEGLAVIG